MIPLETVKLTKIYARKGNAIEGIADVSLQVSSGEILSLLGPNGAGKTTFIRMICSGLTPDSGDVLMGGISVIKKTKGHLQVRRTVGYAPENPFYYGKLTGWEFAHFLESVYRYSLDEGKDLSFVSLSERFQLTPHLDKLIGAYSKGTLRKLIIALAVAFGTRLIILDEPSNGLDPDSYLNLREILFECRARERAVLLSTHQLAMAQELGNTIAIFSNGKMQCLVRNENNVEELYKVAVSNSGVLV